MTTLDGITVMDEVPSGGEDAEAGIGGLDTVRGGLPLVRLAVTGRITGPEYRLTVAQTFVNVHSEPVEAIVIFPLPSRAGVTCPPLLGDGGIAGVLQERGMARAEYDRALRQGQRAALVEEDRPEVFTLRAGNIPPGEVLGVDLELAGPLAIADGEASLRFPLVVAPRHIPGVPLAGPGVGPGRARDTDAVPDTSRITPPRLPPGFASSTRLDFHLELDPTEDPVADPRGGLHALSSRSTAAGGHAVALPLGERLDRDVLVRFPIGATSFASSLRVYRDSASEATLLLTLVPPAELGAGTPPRDVVVLLDRSASMAGWKLAAARRAAARLIDTLTERDRFGLILFDDRPEEAAPGAGRLVPATDCARFRAVEFLARVEARGGTEIAPALTRALGYFPRPPEPDRERILLFVTDGQVGNEDQLLRQVHQQARDCRIVVVGIDRAVNASLLERLADYGGGHCTLVESEDRLDAALSALRYRLGAPLLTDLRLDPPLQDLAPEVTDLFPGVPLRLGGRWSGPGPAQVTVTGRTPGGGAFRQTLVPVDTADITLRTLWARARLLDLEHRFVTSLSPDAGLADAITAFSLRYGVLSRFTAFVAVDHASPGASAGPPRPLVQAVERPSAWVMAEADQAPAESPRAGPSRSPAGRANSLATSWGEPEYLKIPAFLSRLARPVPSPDRYRVAWASRAERLEARSSMLDPVVAALGRDVREEVVKLDTTSERAAAMAGEGREILRSLERDRPEDWRRLADWLRRVRELLAQPAARRWRGFWWR